MSGVLDLVFVFVSASDPAAYGAEEIATLDAVPTLVKVGTLGSPLRCGRESLAEESATVPRGSRRRIDPPSRGKTESSFCNLLVRSCHDGGAVNDQLNVPCLIGRELA